MEKKSVIAVILIFCSFFTVEADEVFRISTSYNNLLSNPEQTGILDLVMKEVFKRIDVPMELVFTETDKSAVDVNSGIHDAEMNRIAGFNKTFANLLQVPEPNMIMKFVAFSRKDFKISGWSSIRNLYIGYVQGWKIIEDNLQGYPHVIATPTEKELFRMLNSDRIDIALYSLLTGRVHISENGYQGITVLDPPLASREMFLYVHKKHINLVEKIADALREMKKDGTYDKIFRDVMGSAGGH